MQCSLASFLLGSVSFSRAGPTCTEQQALSYCRTGFIQKHLVRSYSKNTPVVLSRWVLNLEHWSFVFSSGACPKVEVRFGKEGKKNKMTAGNEMTTIFIIFLNGRYKGGMKSVARLPIFWGEQSQKFFVNEDGGTAGYSSSRKSFSYIPSNWRIGLRASNDLKVWRLGGRRATPCNHSLQSTCVCRRFFFFFFPRLSRRVNICRLHEFCLKCIATRVVCLTQGLNFRSVVRFGVPTKSLNH